MAVVSFGLYYKQCFIESHHVNDHVFFVHTLKINGEGGLVRILGMPAMLSVFNPGVGCECDQKTKYIDLSFPHAYIYVKFQQKRFLLKIAYILCKWNLAT